VIDALTSPKLLGEEGLAGASDASRASVINRFGRQRSDACSI